MARIGLVFIFLADEGFSGFQGLSLVLLMAGAIAASCWMLLFAGGWLVTRPVLPGTGPATREGGAGSPAIVKPLVNCWCATRAASHGTLSGLYSPPYLRL